MPEKNAADLAATAWRPPHDSPAGWDERSIGEWLRAAIVDWCGLDEDPWAVELVGRIFERLNRVRASAAPLVPVVLFVEAPNAFTAPGEYVYVTRGLLHRAWWEEAAALAVAHEMAHHDLGHMRAIADRLAWCRWLPGLAGPAVFLVATERWLSGPERELAADARALDLCLAAGYDPNRCLDLFGVFEAYLLDHGDIDGVFGPDHRLEEPQHGVSQWLTTMHDWTWQRMRGYPSIHARRDALRARLGGRRSGVRRSGVME